MLCGSRSSVSNVSIWTRTGDITRSAFGASTAFPSTAHVISAIETDMRFGGAVDGGNLWIYRGQGSQRAG